MEAAVIASDVPVLDEDPFAIDVILRPYAFQEAVREIGPISFVEKYGSYAVGRYDDVRKVLTDWESFTSAAGAGLSNIRKPGAWREPGPIVEADPPDHTDVRRVVTKIISPAVIRGWKSTFEAAASQLVDRICQSRAVDGAKDIAEHFVLNVFPPALGLHVHIENLVTIGDYNFNALGPKNELFLRSQEKLEAISDWYTASQTREGVIPGSFAEMLFDAEDAGELKPGVAGGLARTFLRGGMDTTISGIGSSLMFLARDPDLWTHLRSDRGRLKLVFEEALRLESPIQSYFRTTTKPVEFGGHRLEPDTKLQLFIGAANRDPRKWPNPDQFDISRSPAGHLSFGHGIHLCVGQMIARMEAESVLNALLDKVERLELAGEPTHRPLNTLRTLEALPLAIVPA
ncbi:cytochrome P450 [Sphingosinicella rhizophila]|uniref:Cytochrome P450 n=1 Tax=Sphingosinicella rhizophila TaxID=3050082 RepID=A0ABU3QAV3_9SPHN|nr:cytochrome P450 [Sphingosinicella sp. GR2756]MDT9600532.1 cytochrome P450 [Sphingosinicella sp. GR2756]